MENFEKKKLESRALVKFMKQINKIRRQCFKGKNPNTICVGAGIHITFLTLCSLFQTFNPDFINQLSSVKELV